MFVPQRFTLLLLVLSRFSLPCWALRYYPEFVDYNLNQNENTTNPLEYSGKWEDHTFHASPDNWRFPFYTLFLDRFVNGDPTNDNANDTVFEQEVMGTQLRFGGDIQGLADSLDYIQGFGIKGLYVAGSPFINQPWGSDAYSPLDHTLLDLHFGNITAWRAAIDEIHKRGMYIILDNTVATMGDLVGFKGYLNKSAPFVPEHEHEALWKASNGRRYHDFDFGTTFNSTCVDFPRLFWDNGSDVQESVYETFGGCYDGDFDQFGDTEAFGVYADYRRQLTKFASVQDRLREWVPDVRERLERFSCLTIQMLDIDGFRYDKATQVTVDAEGDFSSKMRECAREVNKTNFFIPGEITGGNTFGAVYVGRGRQPAQYLDSIETAANMTNATASGQDIFIRDEGQNALDAAAFHYSIYRNLLRFLGMDGDMTAAYDLDIDFVEAWNTIMLTNDMLNAETGEFDPRHMFGASNQDVFRWPSISYGVERNLLGLYITTLHMPGIPLLLWGEEQAFYVLDNTAANYMFGRQPIASGPAWQAHGCYSLLPATLYFDMPLNASLYGCRDDTVSYDHRDPSHPIRNVIKHMYHMRENYPVLQDGFYLRELSKSTEEIYLPGSSGVGTETGLWSTMRNQFLGIQDLGDDTAPVWLVYHNRNESYTYSFNCSDNDTALISPYDEGTTVKNLFFPHEELNLTASNVKLGINGSTEYNGCYDSLTLDRFEFRAYVPLEDWVPPPPMITKFEPGHDTRIYSTEESTTVAISLHFNTDMECDALTQAINFTSNTQFGLTPSIDNSTVSCGAVTDSQPDYTGIIASAWAWSANVTNLAPGIHQIAVSNATTADGGSYTNAVDRFLLRVGDTANPLVFPTTANYSSTLLNRTTDGSNDLTLTHSAPGASWFRYTTNWGSTYSSWMRYEDKSTISELAWNGTSAQAWKGTHVIVQYWSQLLGSSSYVVHADLDYNGKERRFPHLWASGPFNQYGYDAGLDNTIEHTAESLWEWHYMDEWPAYFQVSVWGMNPDSQPDQSFIFGDVDYDGVLDRMPPSSLTETDINITAYPPKPHLAYRLVIQDSTLKYGIVPVGNMWLQLILYVLLWIVPVLSAMVVVHAFRKSFYKIKFNEVGVGQGSTVALLAQKAKSALHLGGEKYQSISAASKTLVVPGAAGRVVAAGAGASTRRKVLIATMEYNIDDWNIKIKIGGLGVMAQLMGTALRHQDLVWVVPCVGGIEYPVDTPAEPMFVKIMGQFYEVQVQYHKLENITFVLLDAPVFRKQTKAEPYPPRMDDMESAVYYSAWNQCIAETMKRFPVDLYHINDYHGACAPLYLLPKTIPCALSLHNAEFQGMWPMRTPEECKEVCEVYNLPEQVVKDYVQFGSVFNLLHAGASYLRIHQQGFGAVGVSRKYGDRSFARYPIFWGLSKVGQLPNPDPTDTGEWSADALVTEKPTIDQDFEAGRIELKRQAQEWAGLEQNPRAELFVFVGRWSLQKGVDLIADIFPWVLEQYPQTQVICIGPVIDLYGRFAALKLAKLMDKYPGRVFSKPEFTALPPYIFSGAEFALIPSRDEPFGLVAVEFGRKGALGVGARVGGLGQMPGWWYTVESTKASHLLHQFKNAIVAALKTDTETRAMMRAYSAKQRFPVAQWLDKLETLQNSVIKVHDKTAQKAARKGAGFMASTKNLLSLSPSPSKENLDTATELQLRDQRPAWMLSITDLGDNSTIHDPSRISTAFNSPAASRPGTPGFEDWGSRPDSPSMQSLSFSRPFGGHARIESVQSIATMASLPLPLPNSPFVMQHNNASRASMLSLDEVVGERQDYKLQKVDPFFTDKDGSFYAAFERKLASLDASNSASELCIEDFLMRSEKEWFNEYRDVRLGRGRGRSSSPAGRDRSRGRSTSRYERSRSRQRATLGLSTVVGRDSGYDAFEIPKDYIPPTGLKKYLQYQLGEWPVYAILLAASQVIASNSYQVTLLTGSVGQPASKLYTVASIYLASTIVWYVLSRTVPLLYPLAIPFIFYGAAFFVLGFSPLATDSTTQGWVQNVATGLYAFASSSGGITFAFNFGTDGGSTISSWIMRLALIQGVSQLYTIGLWAWGSAVSTAAADGDSESIANSPVLLAVCLPIAFLLWAIGTILYLGLPDFYRETPGPVPQLWKTLLRRKTIAWYLLAVVIQNYFLSAVYGRNWFFLFSSSALPIWGAVLLALGFFVFMWAILLFILARLSRGHPWLFPMFAVGLGAPRWAQTFWGISRIGLWLPWAGSALASAVVSRLLWLWLGLLDGIQGAGIGMILMLTLTRVHVAAAIVGAQVLGSIATIAARASAPDKLGPGPVFPDLSKGAGAVVGSAWFWVVLGLNLGICFGYFKFFRKEQVSKP
ncbi:family 5 glycosyltransferase [Cryphonectria parasitica EP155]|uniref:alpha-1,3-glucan synthase n=1 Tax=Cryphonectria parasitica (strain ATCC 38755 / EP155) TaxID=660469 RepID=A0A9P5CN42_CRYP1|nr:family 5 glycosyltransferase [Cryphonectria parasitica EP155]KAF3763907.1 family 5 glycosyltransferase [Cryphonectria parasitica EP155]